MSGIEIAGLVLGAIPLVIAGLEYYEEGLGKVKAFWKWEDELSEAIRKLWGQYSSYELTIRGLLASITSEAELEEMMGDTTGKLWKSEDMCERLQEKLATAYQPYLYTASEIERIILEMTACLNLNKATQITRNELEAVVIANPRMMKSGSSRDFQFQKRIKFTMKKQKVKRQLEQLESCIARLDTFTEKAEKLEPYKSNNKSKFTVPLHRIQQYAKSLYQVLNRSWGCDAHASHAINLLLEQRMVLAKKKMRNLTSSMDKSSDGVARFVLSISDPSLPSGWRDAEVQVMEESEVSANSKSKVKIAVSPPSPTTQSVTNALKALKEITSVCSALQNYPFATTCPRFYLDHDGKLKGIFGAPKRLTVHDSNFMTLDELIRDGAIPGTQKLTKEEGYLLAVTLSSSLLQLHSTPWLRSRWSKRDISFLKLTQSQKDNGGNLVQVRYPYVTQEWSPQDLSAQDPLSDVEGDSSKLLALGIVLLEIYFNQPIESLRAKTSSGISQQPNDYEDLSIANRWVRREKGNLSWAFQNAVSHCLKCFADPNADLQDPDFRQGVIDEVLIPLQDELSLWTDGPPRG
ncbi:hypothetical protein BU16DRAFT_316252 [Lophium mytilinum]|uniref:DUF7580 domain-containing protein n=1 Tax=Lophium mytilinum TaxID=390894 RepID=A0A6A6QYI6_9PEZI|nr:hypothetical protein BU16DRAFT_316252 [Lophium mytilinum]